MAMMLIGLLGGLSIFVYGMNEMGRGLQQVAGSKLKKILESITSNSLLGVLVGTVVTAIIQSSSATTVMVIGFVNAGLMNLKQAIAVIMGSNIGTTITAQLVTFKITDYYLALIAIGFTMFFVLKHPKVKELGKVIFAFGLLFMGLDIMGSSMAPLQESDAFANFLQTYGGNAFLVLIAGTILTCVIQSSSAAMGILLALSTTGLIGLDIAIPAILGFNIGTCITCVLASIGTKVNAKRAAAAHVIFNLVGAALFFIIMPLFKELILAISPADIGKQIANAHTMFNIITTVLVLPFIGILVKIVTKLVKGEDEKSPNGTIYLDDRNLHDSNMAMGLVMRESVRMGRLAKENLDNAFNALVTRDLSKIDQIREQENTVDLIEHGITDYLVKIRGSGLSEHGGIMRGDMYHVVNDWERISDHAMNVIDNAVICVEHDLYFSDKALEDLKTLYAQIDLNVEAAIECLEQVSRDKAEEVIEREDKIDNLEIKYRDSHIERLEAGTCTASTGVVFLDLLSNLERVGDHCNNIAVRVKNDF